MNIVLLCATRRGYQFLERLHQLAPDAQLTVFSFREESWEPPFLDDIARLAQQVGAQFYEARQVGAARWRSFWQQTPVDLLLAVSWRYMIPADVYQRARLGAWVLHDSLLPAYRGFAPTVWALMNGEDHTGVTLLQMADAYDAGDMVGQVRVPLTADDTIAQVLDRVTAAYLTLLERHLPQLMAGTVTLIPQDHTQATYTAKLTPDDFQIDWHWPTERIYNLIRATTAPYAGAWTTLEGRRLYIWQAALPQSPRHYVGCIPGRVVDIQPDGSVQVLTGDGVLCVLVVQPAEGEHQLAAQVLNRLSHTLGR